MVGEIELQVGGAPMRALLEMPKGKGPHPGIVVCFHMGGLDEFSEWVVADLARQGFVVVSPVAPDGELFHTGAERHLPALLRRVRIDFRVAGNRMHLAGAQVEIDSVQRLHAGKGLRDAAHLKQQRPRRRGRRGLACFGRPGGHRRPAFGRRPAHSAVTE